MTRSALRLALPIAVSALLSAGRITAQEADSGGDNPVTLSASVDLAYQYWYRSSDALIENTVIKNGIDLYRNVLAVPPMALFDLELGRERGLAIGLGGELRRQFGLSEDGTYFPSSNFIPLGSSGNPLATENGIVTKGALYWRGDGLDITFGRDKVDFGEGLRGSLYPSLRLPYLDAFQARGRLGPLGMDWLIATIRNESSWEGSTYDVDPNDDLDASHSDSYGFTGDNNPTIIVEAMHRFTWDFEKLTVGVAGHAMYSRRNNSFSLVDLFPVISWHQTDSISNNLTVYADASWRPLDGLRIMGMAGLDEVDARDVGVNDSGSPTVTAWVLGGEYGGRAGRGKLSLYVEAGYTHFLWGNFDGSNFEDEDVNPLARAIYRFQLDEGAGLLPLTSPYGPGATWGLLSGSYAFDESGFSVGLELLALSKMIDANLIDTPVFTDDPGALTADSPRFFFLEAAVPVGYAVGPLKLYVAPAFLVRDGRWWFEAKIGGSYRFGSVRTIAD